MPTAEDHIRKSNIHSLANGLDAIDFVSIVKGLVPRTIVTTGLTSLAAQPLVDSDGVTPVYGAVGTVTDSSDTGLTKILAGAVGAGEVLVTYDADGRPTLTFNAAVTGYKVEMHHTLPATLVSVLLAKSM
ncbi:hypothetical protein [uncultured Zoogloea sp.]|uniref:hypothetical protein n=1 Tax=uncultured Zoogloea sp. TaxID=160237 RepID=UPI0026366540|nr:hypothetical protein [uncultured Zoogloea sp.]